MTKRIILLGSILSIVSIITGCRSLGSPLTTTETLSFKNVEKISIDVSSAAVDIIKDKRKDILVEFDTYENGDQLKTNEGKNTSIETYNNKSISFIENSDYKLRIYVPEDFNGNMTFDLSSGSVTMSDFNLEDVSFDFSSGTLNISDMTAKEIILELSSGNVNFKNVSTSLLDIDMSSGDVDLEEFTGRIKGSSSSGNFYVSYKEVMDDLNFEASSGSISVDYNDVTIDGNFELSKSSGNIYVNIDLKDFKETKDGDKVTGTLGSGDHDINLDISSGNIKIN